MREFCFECKSYQKIMLFVVQWLEELSELASYVIPLNKSNELPYLTLQKHLILIRLDILRHSQIKSN